MHFVLDCSVAISLCLVDENNDYANAILAMMLDSEAFVPGIWSLEIVNVLLVAERRNRQTQEQSEQAITLLQDGVTSDAKPPCYLQKKLAFNLRNIPSSKRFISVKFDYNPKMDNYAEI